MTTRALPISDLIGIGLYTPSEAARLIAESPRRLVRWVRGYAAGGKQYPPLWAPQIDLGEDGEFLGFQDLIQARVASALIKANLSPQRVRLAITRATEMLGRQHPLATAQFKTDGRRIFLQLKREGEEDAILDILTGQHAFKRIIEPSLRSLDFGDDGHAQRWWPIGRRARIVLDPARSFGHPIDNETGVPVDVLVDAVAAEGSVEAAAKAFQVPITAVRAAIEFYKQNP